MKHLLRWRFDYADKPSVMGMWCRSSSNPVDQAWNKNTGIVRASIEAKNLESKITKVLVSADASQFRNFSWKALGKIRSAGIVHQIVGLQMWTTDKKITAYIGGELVVEDLTEEDKKINFKTYGR